jgi:hypothetical protein
MGPTPDRLGARLLCNGPSRFGAMTILDRFRRMLVPPGRPGEALGVPDSGEDLGAELAPVLSQLDKVDVEAATVLEQAEADARARQAQAERECAAILDEARTRAAAARAEAAAGCRARARVREDAIDADARREVERIQAEREGAVAELVAEVVECVRRTGR